MAIGDYISFGKPSYGDYDFDLAVNRSGVYVSQQFTRKEAIKLLNDMRRALELDAGRPSEWGDLYADTGIEDPDDIIF